MLGFEPGQLPLDAPCLLVLELAAGTDAEARAALEAGLEEVWDEAGVLDGVVATSLQQAQRIWRLREETEIERKHRHPPSFDVSMPGGAIDSYIAQVQAGLKELAPDFAAYVYGYLADGNLHITVTVDGPVAHEVHAAVEDVLYAGLRGLGGSFSAEHGVGIEKRAAYERYADPVKRYLAQAIKALLDPRGVLRPGKFVAATAED